MCGINNAVSNPTVHYFRNRYAKTKKKEEKSSHQQRTSRRTMQTTHQRLPSSPPIDLLPILHTIQLLTQRISYPPLPRPLLTHPLHATAGHDHKTYSSQRGSLLLRLANLAAQAVSEAQTRRRGAGRDAHFREEVEIDLVTVRGVSLGCAG